jgi:hypothetical protein
MMIRDCAPASAPINKSDRKKQYVNNLYNRNYIGFQDERWVAGSIGW